MIPILMLFLSMLPDSLSCLSTAPGGTSIIDPSVGCCPPLAQTLTPRNLPDGILTFSYNNVNCRTTVTATCSSADPAFNLVAGIIANSDNFLDYNITTVSYSGTCVDGAWFMGNPSLQVNTLECVLTNPA